MRALIRFLGLKIVGCIGSTICDEVTGERLGKALILPWRGKIHLVGYAGQPVRLVFRAQAKVNYWRQSIGFRRAQEPDYPRKEAP
jgi:hypothetical protein